MSAHVIKGDMRDLVTRLLELAGHSAGYEELSLKPMKDGNMGSYKIGGRDENRRFGGVLASVRFEDEDGVPALASLIQDQNGALFEIDVWKVDFSPLAGWPTRDSIEDDEVAT